MEKHTPAPWRVDFFNNIWSSAKGRHSKVANLADRPQADGYDQIPEEEVAANARLIAASPDLLAALKKALVWLEFDGGYDVQGIRAVIARAEGEEW